MSTVSWEEAQELDARQANELDEEYRELEASEEEPLENTENENEPA